MSKEIAMGATAMIIAEQGKRIKQLEKQLKEAEKVIEFYGDCKNWVYSTEDYEHIFYDEINDSDIYEGNRVGLKWLAIGGKCARQYLEKYKGDNNE